VPLIVLGILIVLAFIAVIPLSLIQRFRMGTARRTARRWVATLNFTVVALSAAFFLVGALITSRWIPEARTYTLYGLAGGCVLGLLGLGLTRWEHVGGSMKYTPNRWLVLAITLLVAARVLYGFWRGWGAWRASLESAAWVTASGIAGSMSAGAVVLGYYLIFWAGVRRHIRRQERT
jgi:hypothetical protein